MPKCQRCAAVRHEPNTSNVPPLQIIKLGVSDEDEDDDDDDGLDDDDASYLLPADGGSLDAEALSTLPPSLQIEVKTWIGSRIMRYA